MKITKALLKKIIAEEIGSMVTERREMQQQAPEQPVKKQRGDVERVSKKMGAASGLGGLMQNINTLPELQEFLMNIVGGVGKKLKPAEIYRALIMTAKQVQQAGKQE